MVEVTSFRSESGQVVTFEAVLSSYEYGKLVSPFEFIAGNAKTRLHALRILRSGFDGACVYSIGVEWKPA